MSRIVVFLIFFGLSYLSSSFAGDFTGVRSVCVNDECKVTVSSSFGSLIVGLILGGFVVFFSRKVTVSDNENIVGLWRRFGAFFLDFMAVLVVISPFMAIPTLLVEANITGNFQWAFERDFARPTDTQYILPSVISVFLVMYLYFYFYAKYNKQTLGQYVLNYKIIPIDEESMIPQYGLRVFFSYIGLCAWPVSVFLALRKNNKACWWDTTTNTKVIRVIAVNKAHQPTQNPRG